MDAVRVRVSTHEGTSMALKSGSDMGLSQGQGRV